MIQGGVPRGTPFFLLLLPSLMTHPCRRPSVLRTLASSVVEKDRGPLLECSTWNLPRAPLRPSPLIGPGVYSDPLLAQ